MELYWSKVKRCNGHVRKYTWTSQQDNRCKYNLAGFHGAFNVSRAYKMDSVCWCSCIDVAVKSYMLYRKSKVKFTDIKSAVFFSFHKFIKFVTSLLHKIIFQYYNFCDYQHSVNIYNQNTWLNLND